MSDHAPTTSADGTHAGSNGAATTMSAPPAVSGPVKWLDDRLGLGTLGKKQIRKVFPDHWSFMLGEIALWSFVVLLLTGTFLSLWFQPSMAEVEYQGSYDLLRGVDMSAAYASTIELSFDVRAGLLMRQMHHWSAILFIAAMMVHMLRIMFTGAFRKPREVNYVIGALMLMLGTLEGFAGYSLPDDLLSGTGLRIAEGLMRSVPVVGTYVSFFVFGGEFPGDEIVSRLYIVHVLLLPGLILALIAAHLLLLVYHKHTQWPGAGRTNKNVVGYPFLPVYMAKAGGFFFIVFGVTALMGGVMQINPIWLYGPYDPSQVTAGSQPDWYMGWLEGALRIMPNWETHLFGYSLSWNVMIPGVILPGILFGIAVLYPFVEAWITGDKREHHLLQRPRNAPTRTAFIVSLVTFYGLLWFAGGNDIIAVELHWDLNWITRIMRVAVFVGPVIAFIVTKRICLGLQRADREKALHGYETGIIMRAPSGEYTERHATLTLEETWRLVNHEQPARPTLEPEYDANGVRNRRSRMARLRVKLWDALHSDEIPRPSRQELQEAHHHTAGQHEVESGQREIEAEQSTEAGGEGSAEEVESRR